MLKLPAEATQENRPPIFHRPPKSKRQVRSSEPRVARNELPWVMSACAPQLRRSCAINRNNAIPQSLRRELLIRGVGATSSRLRGVLPEVSQGSSLLAT